MSRFLLVLLALVAMTWACTEDGEEVADFQSPAPTQSTPTVVTTLVPTVTFAPTPQATETPEIYLWDDCFGIVQEEGDRLVRIGEKYCIVERSTGYFVSLWPKNLEEAPAVAREAARQLSDPCKKVAYFFGNLPDLGFPKMNIKNYVCN